LLYRAIENNCPAKPEVSYRATSDFRLAGKLNDEKKPDQDRFLAQERQTQGRQTKANIR